MCIINSLIQQWKYVAFTVFIIVRFIVKFSGNYVWTTVGFVTPTQSVESTSKTFVVQLTRTCTWLAFKKKRLVHDLYILTFNVLLKKSLEKCALLTQPLNDHTKRSKAGSCILLHKINIKKQKTKTHYYSITMKS